MKNLITLLILILPIQSMANSIDDELNETYQSTLKNLEMSQKSKLQTNQDDWLKFALGYCSLSAGHPLVEQRKNCMTDMSKMRIQQLKQTSCEEGDTSPYCLY